MVRPIPIINRTVVLGTVDSVARTITLNKTFDEIVSVYPFVYIEITYEDNSRGLYVVESLDAGTNDFTIKIGNGTVFSTNAYDGYPQASNI